jgi:hypothetical protein
LEYVFTVNGEYYGGALRLAEFASEERVQQYCDEAKGKSVILHFDPKDPNVSELRLSEHSHLDISRVTGAPMVVLDESTDCVDLLDLIPDDIRHGK